MKELNEYIDILNYIKLYINEKKFNEDDLKIRDNLSYIEFNIDSIIKLIESIYAFASFIKLFNSLK